MKANGSLNISLAKCWARDASRAASAMLGDVCLRSFFSRRILFRLFENSLGLVVVASVQCVCVSLKRQQQRWRKRSGKAVDAANILPHCASRTVSLAKGRTRNERTSESLNRGMAACKLHATDRLQSFQSSMAYRRAF